MLVWLMDWFIVGDYQCWLKGGSLNVCWEWRRWHFQLAADIQLGMVCRSPELGSVLFEVALG